MTREFNAAGEQLGMAVVMVIVIVLTIGRAMACDIDAIQPQHQGGINDAATGQEMGRDLLERQLNQLGLEMVCGLLQVSGAEQIRAADQHQIRHLKLFKEEILNGVVMVKAGIIQPLLLEGLSIENDLLLGQSLAIDHRHHAADTGAVANLRPLKGLQQWLRQGETTGFDDDAIELIGALQHALHRGKEIVLHRAAQATISQFDNR